MILAHSARSEFGPGSDHRPTGRTPRRRRSNSDRCSHLLFVALHATAIHSHQQRTFNAIAAVYSASGRWHWRCTVRQHAGAVRGSRGGAGRTATAATSPPSSPSPPAQPSGPAAARGSASSRTAAPDANCADVALAADSAAARRAQHGSRHACQRMAHDLSRRPAPGAVRTRSPAHHARAGQAASASCAAGGGQPSHTGRVAGARSGRRFLLHQRIGQRHDSGHETAHLVVSHPSYNDLHERRRAAEPARSRAHVDGR